MNNEERFDLYLDPFSGIAGDMFLGLLIDLGVNISDLRPTFDKLGLDYDLSVDKVNKSGIEATDFRVLFDDSGHNEVYFHEILDLLDDLEDPVSSRSKKIFRRLAEAEGKVHGLDLEDVHFHEVGAVDAIIEIVGAVKGLELLNVENVYSKRVKIGSGTVEMDHGEFPVPAPATAELIKEFPVSIDHGVSTELVTPTGAAILGELVTDFELEDISFEKVGYGAGDKDLDNPNVIRGFLLPRKGYDENRIALVETNIDDMNPEIYEYVFEKLMENGALDVSIKSLQMKKSRPGVELSVMCPLDKKDEIIEIILKETTSIGVRVSSPDRVEALREIKKIETDLGEAKVKISRFKDNIVNIAPEYDSCKKLAKENNESLKEVYRTVNYDAENKFKKGE